MDKLDEGMAAAMSAAISAPASAPAPAEEPNDDAATGGDASALPPGDDATGSGESAASGDDATDNATPDAAEGTDGTEQADSASDDASAAGKDTAVDPAKAGKPADTKVGEKEQTADTAGSKEPDPLNDPLPNALKKETKERIHTLVDMVKTTSGERDRYKRDFEDLYGAIEHSTANAQQYGQALEYIRMVNSNDRAQQEQALEFMQREVTILARALGKPVPGVNLLEGHQDIIDAVASGKITMEYANEIAGQRARGQHEQRVSQAAATAQAQQTQHARAVSDGKAALNAVEAELKKDPHYAVKRPILIQQLKPLLATMHPSKWAEAFKHAYNALPAPAAAAQAAPNPRPAAPSPGGSGNTPLRAGNPAGSNGARSAPKTMEEAVRAGIANAIRR